MGHSAGLMISPSAVNPSKRYSFSLILGRNKGSNNSKAQATTALTFSPMSTTSSPSNSTSTSPGPLLKPRKRKVEMIPVIWNEEKQHPETAIIPGLEHQRSIPPDLARTVMELRHDPPPMTNYLAHVTHTDVRSWSAALNLPFVDQILGPKYTWRTKLVKFLKDVPSMATGGVFGSRTEGGHENNGEGWAHMRRRRRHRGRAKGVWGYHDVDFLELLLLYYTSPNIESLSLGIVCSRNYFTMEEMPSPRIHERLSRLRRIEIDHVEALALYASAPLRFIQRHQQMFPGQLREIQIRQSYYYSYDMSKAVLDIIHAMDRIEVLDLSVWMGTFSGFETIRTEHLRKLLISHHIDVTDQHMFDQLLEKCPVLEELSIVVTHPDMFLWAVKRKHEEDKKRIQQITTRRHCTAEFCHGDGREAQRNNTRRKNSDSVLGRRGNLRPRLLPPLKNVVFSGPTMDVVSALKHVFFAFRETLESVHVNMHPDASLQLYMHNVDPSFEHLSSASSSSVPTVSPFNTVDAIPLQAATAAAALSSGTGGLPSNFPYPIEIYNHQHHQQTHQQQHLPLHSQQSSLDDPMASSSSLLPWTPHGSSAHHWAHSHHQQLPNAHGFGHGYESLSTSGPSLTPLWALRHRHFLSESRLTPMLGGIGMAVEADGRMRRGRNGGISHSRRRKATSPSGGEDDDEDDEEEGSSRGVGGKSSKLEDGEDDTGEYDDGDEEEETFFPTFEQVACPSPYCLSWSWILPNLRTLSIRGPLATQFSMHLTQFCPRLEAVHISSSHGYVVRHQPFF
ncbi:hypothetical protein BGW41_003583 [Actinomortierella wolfii]|nr:hypothetical protein BGW41_003583 [Actinomortierella wolfii]